MRKNKKTKLTNKPKRKWLKRIIIGFTSLLTLFIAFLNIFFHTNLFAGARDAWVQTAMATSSHKWLATDFLSDSEIEKILAKYAVKNTTNSNSAKISLTSTTSNKTSLKEISGSTYKGYVVSISNPSSVKLISTLASASEGTQLSQTVSSKNLKIAINAAGFNFGPGSTNSSNTLVSLTIMDGKLLYGDANTTYQMIGMTKAGKLVLGNYTYKQAIAAGIDDAISFGPYLIVNGEKQVTTTGTGGYQPRTAIGQAKDGTIYFVVIEGREADSAGATLDQLQDVMAGLGCINAANLDGGGSSELYYDGKLVNNLSNGSEREIPNAFVVEN